MGMSAMRTFPFPIILLKINVLTITNRTNFARSIPFINFNNFLTIFIILNPLKICKFIFRKKEIIRGWSLIKLAIN